MRISKSLSSTKFRMVLLRKMRATAGDWCIKWSEGMGPYFFCQVFSFSANRSVNLLRAAASPSMSSTSL